MLLLSPCRAMLLKLDYVYDCGRIFFKMQNFDLTNLVRVLKVRGFFVLFFDLVLRVKQGLGRPTPKHKLYH